ncbi:hypothetical protein AB0L13_44015 [Saccharopolyspora shandongensis]|uniref:hypothetical protein n=1 Tax=Saccharopolyspora shandongensis TaxID=418495 RepID=UPI0034256F5C
MSERTVVVVVGLGPGGEYVAGTLAGLGVDTVGIDPAAVAVHAEVPVERLRNMIYAYPTFHRTVEAALAALG